eukprot:COSAG02_NODE_30442_length_551_cov_0.792035_1_plen_56_part_10
MLIIPAELLNAPECTHLHYQKARCIQLHFTLWRGFVNNCEIIDVDLFIFMVQIYRG